MFRKLRQKVKDEGVINVGIMVTACLAVIGSLISVIYANASQRITVLEVKADVTSVDIASIKTDVVNIKENVGYLRSLFDKTGMKPIK